MPLILAGLCSAMLTTMVRGISTTPLWSGGKITPNALFCSAWGARLMTLECGIRFLTDYLEGDHYFHIARLDHNLNRACTQFTLVRQMEEFFDQMLEIICPDNH